MAPRREDPGRVDEDDLAQPFDGDATQPRPGGLDLVGDDGDLLADQPVDQSRLAGIRRPDDRRKAAPADRLALVGHFQIISRRRKLSAASCSARRLDGPPPAAGSKPLR